MRARASQSFNNKVWLERLNPGLGLGFRALGFGVSGFRV